MKQTGALAVILALALAHGGCRRAPPPRLTERTFALGNGLEVELVAGPCGDGAEVLLVHEVGADHDPPARSGLTRVLATATGREVATDHLRRRRAASADGLPAVLDELAAELGGPGPAAAEVERARAEALAALAAARGGDATATAMAFAAESVRPSPGEGWRGGIAGELEAVTAAEVDAFARAHLQAASARLVVVGRFDPAALQARIEAAFAALPAGAAAPSRPSVPATVTGTLVMGDAPAVVAIAVPAPAPTAPAFPAFLVHAARATGAGGDELAVTYDPLVEPALLFVTAAVAPGERPEAAATRVRAALATILARPLAPADLAAARARYRALLGGGGRELEACRADRPGFALGRARRAQLGLDGAALGRALDATTAAQLADAAALFAAERTAAVVAGGAIR